jgi:opacity protein-like surface antigen
MTKWTVSAAIAFALAILTCSGLAADKDSGPYVGLGLGQGTYRNACSGITISCSESSIAGKGYVGYRFFSYLAAETGFTYFGRASLDAGGLSLETKGWGVPLYAVGILPLADDKLWLMAKAGGVYWDLKTTASFLGTDLSVSDNGFAFAYGGGLQYNFTPNLGARAEYEVFRNVGNANTTGKGDIHVWTLGVVWRF